MMIEARVISLISNYAAAPERPLHGAARRLPMPTPPRRAAHCVLLANAAAPGCSLLPARGDTKGRSVPPCAAALLLVPPHRAARRAPTNHMPASRTPPLPLALRLGLAEIGRCKLGFGIAASGGIGGMGL